MEYIEVTSEEFWKIIKTKDIEFTHSGKYPYISTACTNSKECYGYIENGVPYFNLHSRYYLKKELASKSY